MNEQSNGEWNMAIDDYEALLKPEREQPANDEQAQTAAWNMVIESTEEPLTPEPQMRSLADDVAEALELLSQAEQQRKTDVAKIRSLEDVNASFHHRMDADAERIQILGTEIDGLRNIVARLETENNRLMGKLKTEISRSATLEEKINRGLLRQGMDNLRKVLPGVDQS